jgi:hypothetical protein
MTDATLTPEQIEAIRKRAEAATPGPWLLYGVGLSRADFDYIKHARQDIPALLSALEAAEKANEPREDYRLFCDECGRAHILDTSIPSEIWNQIADGNSILCAVCIDKRLTAKGLKAEASFYYVGDSLVSRNYAPELEERLSAAEQQIAEMKPRDEYADALFANARNQVEAAERREQAAKEVAAQAAQNWDAAERRAGEAEALAERLKREAVQHAQEARTANSTIAEIYQVVCEGKGEPGNWNGAEPVRERFNALRARVERLEGAWQNVDDQDWEYLLSLIGDGGRARFWKDVFAKWRTALTEKEPRE